MKTFTLNATGGKNNVKDHIFRDAGKTISFLKEGRNIDIDDDGFWRLRKGRSDKKYTGAVHSADQKGSGLFVEDSVLKKITSISTTPYTVISIATMSNNNPMVYAHIPGRGIACSNGTDIGIVANDVFTPFSEPSEQYKRKMPAGQILAWYNGFLLVARGSDIYYSDPQAYGIMDTRNKRKHFKSYITMMVPVDDGLFISDSHETFFYLGPTPHHMDVKVVADYPAIYGMNISVEQRLVGDGRTDSAIVYWESTKGTCLGTSGGKFMNITIQKYKTDSVPQKGTAFFRNNQGIPQFIGVGII